MEAPVVQIADGALKGTTIEGYNGLFLILAFLGIPYARPPVGELRFKVSFISLILMENNIERNKIFS